MTEIEEEVGRLDLTPDPRILEVLGKIPYQPWQCLAELIDNSFDELLTDPAREPGRPATVYITAPKASASDEDAQVTVSDEGRGMSRETLEKALRAGYTGKTGLNGTLGLFGMGFNIATARLGNRTEVHTTRAGDMHWLVAEVDLRAMQRRGSFNVPVRHAAKDDPAEHGTRIVVRDLNSEMLDALRRPATITSVRQRLGRVYSYLLRSANPIPGLSDKTLAGRGISLYLNSRRIEPWIPCVWSQTRSVSYKGSDVKAVQVVDHKLTDAYVCLRCGYWQRHSNSGVCLECDAEDLELRHRQVHGWLGVQRYLSDSQFGIDFIRNGRMILTDEKVLFTWEDLATGDKHVEYPVDFAHQGGRLVGEIHLDHVPVDYQKTDFKRETPEWREAVIHLRGEGPMREQKAKERGYPDNASPLGRLFKAYQENRPGLRYLIPGDGRQATHELAREWGAYFHKGLPEYQTDEKWYEAAAQHHGIRVGGVQTDDDRTRRPDKRGGGLGSRTGLDPLPPSPIPVAKPSPSGGQGPSNRSSTGETEDERFTRYRRGARELYDLAREITVTGLGKRKVRVFETGAELVNASGIKVPVVSRMATGMDLEVLVNGEHPVFREYGRDPRDWAIIEIAQTLRVLASSSDPITSIIADVTCQFPDQRTTPSALRDRADTIVGRVRDLMAPVVADHAAEMWNILPSERKVAAERDAARSNPTLDWREATRDGRFAAHLDCASIAMLVGENPGSFLDSAVFTVNWASWSDQETRDRQVAQVVRLLDTLSEFLADPGPKSRLELSMIRLAMDMLDQMVSRTD